MLFGGQTAFLIGLGLFLVTHLAYLGCFVAAGALSGLRGRWWVPVLYGLALFTMAALAGCRDGVLGLGGLLFAVSDVVNGLGSAHLSFPGAGLVVMAAYVAAQAVIVLRYAVLSGARRG